MSPIQLVAPSAVSVAVAIEAISCAMNLYLYASLSFAIEWSVQPNLAPPSSTPPSIPASTPASTPARLKGSQDKIHTDNALIIRLIKVIGHEQMSIKQMLEGVGLKDRMNFLDYNLNPAIAEGFVRMLYPDKPRHPRQRYLLTVKGLALYKELGG